MSVKISDLTVEEFTDFVSVIIDQRIEAVLAPDGELREDFARELLYRIENPDLAPIDEVWK